MDIMIRHMDKGVLVGYVTWLLESKSVVFVCGSFNFQVSYMPSPTVFLVW